MFNAIRYYWVTAKGYRTHPWDSPYLRWRMETFFGHEAGALRGREFVRLLWRERRRMKDFLRWVAQQRRRAGKAM